MSPGAACSSGKVTPSHVLAAMGVPDGLIRGAIRLSLGYSSTEAEIEAFLKAWAKLADSLYKSDKTAGYRRLKGVYSPEANRPYRPKSNPRSLKPQWRRVNAGRARDDRAGSPHRR